MSTEVLIEKLTKAVAFAHKNDKTAPGLTISILKKGYYCSIVRYDEAFGKGKVVLCKATASTLEEALTTVAKNFLATSKPVTNPVDDLSDFLVVSP